MAGSFSSPICFMCRPHCFVGPIKSFQKYFMPFGNQAHDAQSMFEYLIKHIDGKYPFRIINIHIAFICF